MLRRTVASMLLVLGTGVAVHAQDLGTYDPNNYSGGYAEGAYAPLGDEQLYPYDSQDQWQHGYIQYMPFYGAYKHFRPYNYKHVSAQTQAAAGWGMSPRMPYSQQYWHRYHSHAKMGHSASGAYESYLDVPVPKKDDKKKDETPERRSPADELETSPREPAPQPPRLPMPYRGPGMTPPAYPDSVQFGAPAAEPYAGISYRQPPQQPVYGQPAAGQSPYGQPAYGQPVYSQPAFGQAVYGQPQYDIPVGAPYQSAPYGAQNFSSSGPMMHEQPMYAPEYGNATGFSGGEYRSTSQQPMLMVP